MTDDEKLIFVYYLQLQDRIKEAMNLFAQIEEPTSTLRIQYDYLKAYFDFFKDDGYKTARALVRKYDNHPVQ